MLATENHSQSSTRKGLLLYGTLVLLFSALIQTRLILSNKRVEEEPLWVLLLMWIPGLACIVTRFVLREGFRDVSFRINFRQTWRILVLAWIYPIPIGLVAYGLAWSCGLADFSSPPLKTFGIHSTSSLLNLISRIGLAVVLLTPMSLVSAFGEELGWRGYLVPRLAQTKAKYPKLADRC